MEEQLLTTFSPLIYKTLSRLGVTGRDPNYDDYLQGLRMEVLRLATNFDKDPLGDGRYHFVAYAKQWLFWKGQMMIRKNVQSRCASLDSVDSVECVAKLVPLMDADQRLTFFLGQVTPILSAEEYFYLMILMDGSLTQAEIAKGLGISRKTWNKRLRALRIKLTPYRYLLTEDFV